MPLYDYKCQNESCGEEIIDEYISWQDSDKEYRCPKCNGICMKKPSKFAKHLSWSQWNNLGK